MSKIKSFVEFLKEEMLSQTVQPVQSQPIRPIPEPQVQQPPQVQQSPQVQKPKLDPTKANKKIDFTYLDKDANIDKIRKTCETAKTPENQKYIFGVVVRPEFISETKKYLEDSGIKTIAAVSYPNGDDKNSQKMKELQKVISDGAEEVNVVMDYNKLIEALSDPDKEKQQSILEDIQSDIRSLVEYCKSKSIVIKVIIEMEALGDITIISKAVELCKKANVNFIMTSTGMYNKNTSYTFEQKIKDVTEMIIPMIQGIDDMNIDVCGGVNDSDKLMMCFKNSKIQRITTSTTPQMLFNTQSQPPIYKPQSQDELITQAQKNPE